MNNNNYLKKDNSVCHSFKSLALTSSCVYIYVSCHKESLLHASLCFQTYLNMIIIDVHNKLSRSITVTAKSSKKIKGEKKGKIS